MDTIAEHKREQRKAIGLIRRRDRARFREWLQEDPTIPKVNPENYLQHLSAYGHFASVLGSSLNTVVHFRHGAKRQGHVAIAVLNNGNCYVGRASHENHHFGYRAAVGRALKHAVLDGYWRDVIGPHSYPFRLTEEDINTLHPRLLHEKVVTAFATTFGWKREFLAPPETKGE